MIKVVIATTAALSMLVRRNSSLLSAAAVLASVAVIMPGVAGAAPAVPKGETATQDFPAGELCAFPVRVTTVYGQTTHNTGQGDTLVTGPFTATVTNLTTGATETFNISGPSLFRTGPDVPTVVTGPNLVLQPASRNVGPPFLIYTTGRVAFTPNFTIASRTGNVTDVCAALS